MQRTYIRHRYIQKRHLRNSRILAMLAISAIIALAISLSFSSSVEASRGLNYQDPTQVKIICVGEGDSLWQIAKDYYSDYDGDIREVIHKIKKTNRLSTADIYDGQILYLPINI